MSVLMVEDGLLIQHPDESIIRTVDFDKATTAGSVSSPAAKAFDEGTGEEVTSTVFPTNTPSVSTLVVTLSLLTALTDNKTYRIEVSASDGTNTLVSVHRVRCQRD